MAAAWRVRNLPDERGRKFRRSSGLPLAHSSSGTGLGQVQRPASRRPAASADEHCFGSDDGGDRAEEEERGSFSPLIVIHVIDEVRRMKRDFTCSQALLRRHMKYFEHYLEGVTGDDEVDISVHCDIMVFEWLVQYMECAHTVESLEPAAVVSILISAEFLQMKPLADACLVFMHNRIEEVVGLPLDLGCLSAELVRRLSLLFTDEELEEMKDRRDRLQSRLFAHKIEHILSQDANVLRCCSRCRKLFLDRQLSTGCATCQVAAEALAARKTEESQLNQRLGGYDREPTAIRICSEAAAQHDILRGWNVGQFIRYCRMNLTLSWRAIYWRIWGHVHFLRCSRCHQHFSCSEYEHCNYHPEEVVWDEEDEQRGVYPCCNRRAFRLCPDVPCNGCCGREHLVEAHGSEESVFRKLLAHRDLICVPFSQKDTVQLLGSPEQQERSERTKSRSREPAAKRPESRGDRRAEVPQEADLDAEDLGTGSGGSGGESDTKEFPQWTRTDLGLWETILTRSQIGEARYCCDQPPEHSLGPQQTRLAYRERGRSARRRRPKSAGRVRSKPGGTATEGEEAAALDEVADAVDGGPDADAPMATPGASPTSAEEESAAPGPPSFFNPVLPKNCSAVRRAQHLLDNLREDDRRHMDALAWWVWSRRAEAAQLNAAKLNAAAAQRQSIQWMCKAKAPPASPARRPGRQKP